MGGNLQSIFHIHFQKLGITVKFVDGSDPKKIFEKKAITGKTKAVYAETIGNPKRGCVRY
ncbi:hypothetical protein GCM10020331_100070 [Ectobacillus funiculus]